MKSNDQQQIAQKLTSVSLCVLCGKKSTYNFSSCGASMVEFTLAATLLLGFTGIIIDFGMGLHRYGTLSYVTASVAREVGTLPLSCEDMKEKAVSRLKEEYPRLGGGENISSVSAEFDTSASYPSLKLMASIPLDCFFCIFIPRDLYLTSSSAAVIESGSCS